MRRRAGVGTVFAAVLLGLPATPAHATGTSAERVRALALRASRDPTALRELRAVDRVDGRSVDLAAVLSGARDGDLRARLASLADGAGGPPSAGPTRAAAGANRADARKILAERRFRPASVPRPFRHQLQDLGRALEPLWALLGRLVRGVPGGPPVFWTTLSLLVLLATGLLARHTARRRTLAGDGAASARRERHERVTAGRLEREADAAERAGDLERALGLRFRAGLLHLDAKQAIAFRPSISTHEVSRALNSPEFDALASRFDEVAYGGRAAAKPDVDAAREGWPRIVRAAA